MKKINPLGENCLIRTRNINNVFRGTFEEWKAMLDEPGPEILEAHYISTGEPAPEEKRKYFIH
jgi:hypothetical protein